MGTVVIMIKTQIGLGVLSIPSAFDALGLVPGVICLLTVGGMITWGNYVVGRFKERHPDVYSIVDVGEKLFGKIGREVFMVLFLLCMVSLYSFLDRYLTSHRVDCGRCCRILRYCHFFQRHIVTRYLYRSLRCRSRNSRFPHF
jgi:hypothetical protein